MEYLHLFETADEASLEYQSCETYHEPWVAYVEENNTVLYNKPSWEEVNKESWKLFNEIFCDNVTEEDEQIFKNYVIKVTSRWTSTGGMNPTHTFTAKFMQVGSFCGIFDLDSAKNLKFTYSYDEFGESNGTYKCKGGSHVWVNEN